MKIVYAGSPEFAVQPLKRLLDTGAQVAAVITQPDRPVGRKKVLTPTPVKQFAQSRGITVYDFEKIGGHIEELKAIGADIMITCAYGQLLNEQTLNCFKGGVWNLHASLLPEFRGASPIQAAILAGKTHTGITVMKTELKMDAGDILLVKRCEIGDKTCGELSAELSVLAADAAEEAVKLLQEGQVQLLLQDQSKATFCKKITKEDCKINFSRPAEEVLRAIKAFSPQPAAYCLLNGEVLNILNARALESSGVCGRVLFADKRGVAVACGENSILIESLQLSGGKAMKSSDFANGRKIKAGDILE